MLKHKSFEQSLRENDFEFFGRFDRKELPSGIGNLMGNLVHSNIENYAILPLPLLLEGQRELDISRKDDFILYCKPTKKGMKQFDDLKKSPPWQIYMSKFSDEKSETQPVPFEWHSELMKRGYSCIGNCEGNLVDSTFSMLKSTTKYSEVLSLPVEVMGAKDGSFGSRTNLFYFK